MFFKLFSPDYNKVFKPRYGHRLVNIDEKSVLILGGGNLEFVDRFGTIYDLENNTCHNIEIKYSNNVAAKSEEDGLMEENCEYFKGLAAFGMVWIKKENVALIFGGITNERKFSDKLYRLENLSEMKLVETSGDKPTPRIGHTFTKINNEKIFLFGGIDDDGLDFTPKFCNDSYILHIKDQSYIWEKLSFDVKAAQPSPRESHSAVLHDDLIVIFGGANGISRLNDVWLFNFKNKCFTCAETIGIEAFGRSMHSAIIIDNLMYIFGGFIQNDPSSKTISRKCTNNLQFLNLDTYKWNHKNFRVKPSPRSGQAVAEWKGRLFIFSGRNDFITSKTFECLEDLWCIDLKKPEKIYDVVLESADTNELKIRWMKTCNTECYLVEIREEIATDSFKKATIRKSKRSLLPERSSSNVIIKKTKGANEKQLIPNIVINEIKIGNNIEQLDGISDEKLEGNESTDSETESSRFRGIWCLAGIYKENFCTVKSYLTYQVNRSSLNSTNIPNLLDMKQIVLTSGQCYSIRISAINSNGLSKYSNYVTFKTKYEDEASSNMIFDINVECHLGEIYFYVISWKTQLEDVEFNVTIEEFSQEYTKKTLIYKGKSTICKFRSNILSQTNDNFMIRIQVFSFFKQVIHETRIHYQDGIITEIKNL
ncbi:hypothetical protein PVAND_003705 [Polypedilum vanderplanki]|uniref:Host cell factor Kelch-repeats domain-containing protein n=1 Tax=Polypedilum vanderplanki TaxID=319348 RepID=A0A9J6BUV3_POLVA|nr:hypothetical protein PVAND_003705 [Polypedilum vanderplanki]